MADDANTPDGANPVEGQEPEDQQNAGGQEPEGQQDDTKVYDEAYVKQLRDEAAKHRTELRKLQKVEKEREDASKSELEKANGELETLRQERETWQRERTASAFRSQIGLPSPGLALGAATALGITVELDDDGKVKDLQNIQKRLKTEYPREFGDGSADGSATGTKKQPTSMNDMIRAAAGR